MSTETMLMVYEFGGGASNSGYAQVVCSSNGEALRADWLPDRLYSNDRHAGFTPRAGMVLISADWHHGETIAEVRHIFDDGTCGDDVVYTLDANGRETGPAICFKNAAQSAIEKAHCYHCRHQHFIAN